MCVSKSVDVLLMYDISKHQLILDLIHIQELNDDTSLIYLQSSLIETKVFFKKE